MTSRLQQPDTVADRELRAVLENSPARNFVVVAGAGSGKTTSLVKALAHILQIKRGQLFSEGRKVACITYTDVAAKEIEGDIGSDQVVLISTIHSFLWSIIQGFSVDIAHWVKSNLTERIEKRELQLSAPRTRSETKMRLQSEISRLRAEFASIDEVLHWSYGIGSDYKRGVLGHSDIIEMVPQLLVAKPLLGRLLAQRFPYIFVDESQDTDPDFVAALKHVAQAYPGVLCVGFFGDPMQQIFATGVGDVGDIPGWRKIEKPENYRASLRVLDAINAIRAGGDGLVQLPGRQHTPTGLARVYVMPADDMRTERLRRLREVLAHELDDAHWRCDDNVRVLVIAHRMAAARLGFLNLYDAASKGTPEAFRDALREGRLWVLRPLVDYLIPLSDAHSAGRPGDLMAMLRRNAPCFEKEEIVRADAKRMLRKVKEVVEQISMSFSSSSAATIRDVLALAESEGLLRLESRLKDSVCGNRGDLATDSEGSDDDVDAAVERILACPAREVVAYRGYVRDESPYSTQQGVKGAEFARVVVVLDDEEGRHNQFSYDKMFGYKAPSDADQKNVREGVDSVFDRTRRLFYVCCSRAKEELIVALFAKDAAQAERAIREAGIFPLNDIFLFDKV